MALFMDEDYIEIQKLRKDVENLKAEIHNLQCQNRILREKNDHLDYDNKLKTQTIVRYRRLIEHYEDGAPNYVATQG